MECECNTSAADGLSAVWPVELHQAAQFSQLPLGTVLDGLDQQRHVVNLRTGSGLLLPLGLPVAVQRQTSA